MLRLFFILLVTSTLLSSCASTYKPIAPNTLSFDSNEKNGVGFGYRYDVLNFRGNRKYAKREPKKMMRLVALKIENHTGGPMKLGENFHLYAGQNQVYPVDPELVHKELKQGVAIYLLYSLITINKTECDEYTGECTTKLVFPIGVPITIGNMAVAGTANQNFRNELMQYTLANKIIDDGETVYALIGIAQSDLHPLKLVMKDNQEEDID